MSLELEKKRLEQLLQQTSMEAAAKLAQVQGELQRSSTASVQLQQEMERVRASHSESEHRAREQQAQGFRLENELAQSKANLESVAAQCKQALAQAHEREQQCVQLQLSLTQTIRQASEELESEKLARQVRTISIELIYSYIFDYIGFSNRAVPSPDNT